MHDPLAKIYELKDKGGLIKPTQSMITVCKETDKIIQRKLIASNGNLQRGEKLMDRVAITVLGNLGFSKVFEDLNDHAQESPEDEEYHIFHVIKTIAKCYSKIRFHHHLAKQETQKMTGSKIRKNIINWFSLKISDMKHIKVSF